MTTKLYLLVAFATIAIKSNAQNVGIGITAPVARLHVADSNVLFTGPTLVPFTTTFNPPATGPGTRMMWYPQKAAFRVGGVTSTQWDKDSIGIYSFASGLNTKAVGNYSTSMGFGTNASEDYSTSIGSLTKASGTYSTSMGSNTTASGNYSTSMGQNTTASGTFSTSMGLNTKAKAYASLSIGSNNDEIFSSNPTLWVPTDPLFIIGNSMPPNILNPPSNALVVYKNGNTDINGFTQLGKTSEAAPAIKMKKLITTSATTQNGSTLVAHGLNRAKILGVQILLTYAIGTNDIPPTYLDFPGYEFNWQLTPTDVWIINKNANSANILNKPMRILITYEE